MKDKNKLIVRKSNRLIQEYRYSLTLTEIRIVNYLIANIKSPKYDKELRKFDFSIKEFCDVVYRGKKYGAAYKILPEVIQGLSDKSMWRTFVNEKGKTVKTLIRWIERPIFEEGHIIMELNPFLAEHLLQLEQPFSKLEYDYYCLISSVFSAHLYEVLKSWDRVKGGIKVFGVSELMELMDAHQSKYALFKRNALEVAVSEINQYSNLQVSYREIKEGRKVARIEFTISKKQPLMNDVMIASHPSEQNDSPPSGQVYDKSYDDEIPHPEDSGHTELKDQLFTCNLDMFIRLFKDTLKEDFTDKQVIELVYHAEQHMVNTVDYLFMDATEQDIRLRQYIEEKHMLINNMEIKTSRFYALRDKIRNDR